MATKHDVLNVLNSRYKTKQTLLMTAIDGAKTALSKDNVRRADVLAKRYDKKARALYKSIIGCDMSKEERIYGYQFVKHIEKNKTLVANVATAIKNSDDLDAKYSSLKERILLDGATPEMIGLINLF